MLRKWFLKVGEEIKRGNAMEDCGNFAKPAAENRERSNAFQAEKHYLEH